jgi:hypothetical protein
VGHEGREKEDSLGELGTNVYIKMYWWYGIQRYGSLQSSFISKTRMDDFDKP